MRICRIGKTISLGEKGKDFGYYDELAYALATSMIPQIEEFNNHKLNYQNTIQRIKNELSNLQDQNQNLNKQKKAAMKEVEDLQLIVSRRKKEVIAVEAKPWRFLRWLFMLIFGRRWRREYQAALQALQEEEKNFNQKNDELIFLNRRLMILNDQMSQLSQTLSSLKEEGEKFEKIPKIVDGIRSLYYPILPLTIQMGKAEKRPGKEPLPKISVFIDLKANAEPIDIPRINLPQENIFELEENISKLRTDEVLLDPEDEREKFGEWGKVYGSEKILLNTIELFVKCIQGLRSKSFIFPVIKKESPIGKYLLPFINKLKFLEEVDTNWDQITHQQFQQFQHSKDQLKEILKGIKGKKFDIDTLIDRLEKELNSSFEILEQGRGKSSLINEAYLKQSRHNSLLIRYHYFCPLCNATPIYLKRFFNIWPEDIEKLNTENIVKGLQHFQLYCFNTSLGKKFDNEDRERIQRTWDQAFQYLRELEQDFIEIRQRSSTLETGGDWSVLEEQFRASTIRKIYKSTVRDMLKNPLAPWKSSINKYGDEKFEFAIAKPFDVLNPNTRLIYTPGNQGDEWKCPICEMTFNMDIAQFGAVDKIRYDILYPMIYNLWNHESVWGKKVDLLKDIGREIRDRRVEESSALQSPIDQFLADNRQIRLQLEQSYAKGEATLKHLKQTLEEFNNMGLLDKKELERIVAASEKSKNITKQVDDNIREILQKENEIRKIPQKVFYDRIRPTLPEEKIIMKDVEANLFPIRNMVQEFHHKKLIDEPL